MPISHTPLPLLSQSCDPQVGITWRLPVRNFWITMHLQLNTRDFITGDLGGFLLNNPSPPFPFLKILWCCCQNQSQDECYLLHTCLPGTWRQLADLACHHVPLQCAFLGDSQSPQGSLLARPGTQQLWKMTNSLLEQWVLAHFRTLAAWLGFLQELNE